jgi:hypothetical protein
MAKTWEDFVRKNPDRVLSQGSLVGILDETKGRSKYGNKDTFLEGRWFDSEGEAFCYRDYYKPLLLAGVIANLEFQVPYILQDKFTDVNGVKHRAITYVGDFRFVENGKVVVADLKGKETRTFLDKKKMFLKRYPEIVFRIVKKEGRDYVEYEAGKY